MRVKKKARNEKDITIKEKEGNIVDSEESSEKSEMEEDVTSDSENSNVSDMDDEIQEDEFDIDEEEKSNEEESSDEENNNEEVDNDNEMERENPRKKSRQEQFGSAVGAILSSKVKAHDRSNPILIRSRVKLKDLKSEKLDAKAKHAIAQDKKALEDKDRVKNILEPVDGKTVAEMQEHEKKLKKIGQRGVVRLFNALQASHQVQDDASVKSIKKQEHVNEMSKEKFLDLIRSGGKK